MDKQEKVNPVSGCLPIMVQIPVFIAFYWMLLDTVASKKISVTTSNAY
jgi:YidC/Oxa1 family membrane protein insertase